jgi:hypothetical protein
VQGIKIYFMCIYGIIMVHTYMSSIQDLDLSSKLMFVII